MSDDETEIKRAGLLSSFFYRDRDKPSIVTSAVASAWELLTSGKVNENDHPSLFRSLMNVITGADKGE